MLNFKIELKQIMILQFLKLRYQTGCCQEIDSREFIPTKIWMDLLPSKIIWIASKISPHNGSSKNAKCCLFTSLVMEYLMTKFYSLIVEQFITHISLTNFEANIRWWTSQLLLSIICVDLHHLIIRIRNHHFTWDFWLRNWKKMALYAARVRPKNTTFMMTVMVVITIVACIQDFYYQLWTKII